MLVQDFLRGFNDPAAALAAIQGPPHHVVVAADGRRALFNYGLDTPRGGMYDECRALILSLPTFDALSLSFPRFYNSHEGHAAQIDWATAVVQEKVDGSLIVFYHDEGRWTFHTRGTLDAEGELPARNGTFRERVLALLATEVGGPPDALFQHEDTDLCFVCEYVGPYNRIVTRYDEEDLYLLAVTDRYYQAEVPGGAGRYPWPWSRPREYALPQNLAALQDSLKVLPPLSEGYVVKDSRCRRIKVKNPSYLAVHNAISAGNAPTDKNFARLALIGDTAEIKGYFPEFAGRIEEFEGVAERLAAGADGLWAEHRHLSVQKDFALAVKHHPLAPWLFLYRAGKTPLGVRAWMAQNMPPERLVQLAASV